MSDYKVEEVVREGGVATKIVIRVGNVMLTFRRGKRLPEKGSDAQILDPHNLWIPKNLYNKAVKQAAGIFGERRPKGRS